MSHLISLNALTRSDPFRLILLPLLSIIYCYDFEFYSIFSSQVFTRAKVFFSIGGHYFNGEPVHYSYMPDNVMESSRDVTIKLHHRIGKYIQVHLYFAARWVMLSEVTFISSECTIFSSANFVLFFLSSYFIQFSRSSDNHMHNSRVNKRADGYASTTEIFFTLNFQPNTTTTKLIQRFQGVYKRKTRANGCRKKLQFRKNAFKLFYKNAFENQL